MEQENEEKEAGNAMEASTEGKSSEKKTPKSLKARSKIAKKLAVDELKAKNAKVTTRARNKNKNKNLLDERNVSNGIEEEGSKKLNSMEENQKENLSKQKDTKTSQQSLNDQEEIGGSDKNHQRQKGEEKIPVLGKRLMNQKDKEKQRDAGKGQENLSKQKDTKTSQQSLKDQEEIGGSDKNQQRQKGEEKIPVSGKRLMNQKDKEKQRDAGKGQENLSKQKDTKTSQQSLKDQEEIGGSDKNQQRQKGEEKIPVLGNRLRNQKDKEKQRDAGKDQEKEMRKEKLGGLIFMCSKKTKPDCFHYRVMGVSGGKKDLVLGIKPGLKLFLYDFDLRLMYGIFKASSSGGMKLEPKAFGGAFPAQVRFDLHRDCLPLPESIFKKAIKENYNEKQKFKIELTPRQVRKLSELFRPAAVHSTALPVLTAPVPKVVDREVCAGVGQSNREKFASDPYANASSWSYNRLSLERDQRIAYGKGSSLREEAPRDLYMTEKEYRAYGLQGERKNLSHIAAPLDPYQRGHERGQQQLLRHPDAIYGDNVPVSREHVPADPLYLTEREHQTYNVGSRHELPSRVSSAAATTLDLYPRDPYSAYRYGASSVDPYLPPLRREDITSGSYSVAGQRENYLAGTDTVRRGEADRADRLYSSYATSALSNYNRQHQSEGPKPELAAAPVSSRYSFAGPAFLL